MQRLASFLFVLSLAGAGFAAPAQERPEVLKDHPRAVVELFTSQGCSSCPPADRYFSELAKRQDLVTLAYHVDYWDYIGWPDTFGSTANSNFQRAYAKANNQLQIYTPQIVVNGSTGMVGSNQEAVETAIDEAALPVSVSLSLENGVLDIAIAKAKNGTDALAEAESTIWLVPYQRTARVMIARGENRGRTISYDYIAGKRQVLGMWAPATGAHVRVPLSDVLGAHDDGIAVMVQKDKNGLPGKILGAASLTL